MSIVALAFGGVLVLVAIGALGFGARELALAYRILTRDPDVVLDAPNGGPIELEGVVEVDREVLRSPFTDAECVAYEYSVEEKRRRTQSTGNSTHTETYWKTIASGDEAVPFRLVDDTGSVLVEADGAEMQLTKERTIRVDGGTEPPAEIARYIAEDERVDDQNRRLDLRLFELKTGRDRRFVERRLDVGESAHVLGVARYDPSVATASGQVNAVVGGAPEALDERWQVRLRHRLFGPRFLVSDTAERRAALRVALPGLVAVLGGGVGLVVVLSFVV